jgi:hypothetical protein
MNASLHQIASASAVSQLEAHPSFEDALANTHQDPSDAVETGMLRKFVTLTVTAYMPKIQAHLLIVYRSFDFASSPAVSGAPPESSSPFSSPHYGHHGILSPSPGSVEVTAASALLKPSSSEIQAPHFEGQETSYMSWCSEPETNQDYDQYTKFPLRLDEDEANIDENTTSSESSQGSASVDSASDDCESSPQGFENATSTRVAFKNELHWRLLAVLRAHPSKNGDRSSPTTVKVRDKTPLTKQSTFVHESSESTDSFRLATSGSQSLNTTSHSPFSKQITTLSDANPYHSEIVTPAAENGNRNLKRPLHDYEDEDDTNTPTHKDSRPSKRIAYSDNDVSQRQKKPIKMKSPTRKRAPIALLTRVPAALRKAASLRSDASALSANDQDEEVSCDALTIEPSLVLTGFYASPLIAALRSTHPTNTRSPQILDAKHRLRPHAEQHAHAPRPDAAFQPGLGPPDPAHL